MASALSRRGLLVGGGAALGGMALSQAAAADTTLPPTSPRFDLADASDRLFREKPLRNVTVLQSFAFDNVNQRIYVVQVLQGGVQLAEPAPVSGSARNAAGDRLI